MLLNLTQNFCCYVSIYFVATFGSSFQKNFTYSSAHCGRPVTDCIKMSEFKYGGQSELSEDDKSKCANCKCKFVNKNHLSDSLRKLSV